ncbi:MAG: type IX secretion system outer membrane channel protein PorV [Bacteroidales bacterium]
MMRKKFLVVLIIFIAGVKYIPAQDNLSPGELAGAENTIQISVPFLTIAPDSRAGAMGDAGVATSPDVNSLRWNPSKYAFMENDMGLAVSYTPWLRNLDLDDIYLAHLIGYKRLDRQQVISGSLLYFSLGNITFRDEFGEYNGQHTPNEFAIDAAYSRLFGENVAGGIAFRYIRSDLTGGGYVNGSESKAGQSVAADVSAYYQKDNLSLNDRAFDLAFGLNIRNIGSKISYTTVEESFIPTTLKIGGAVNFHLDQYNSVMLTTDLNKLLVPTPPVDTTNESGDRVIVAGMNDNVSVPQGMLQSFYDAPGGLKEELNEIRYSFGLEYLYQSTFAVRGGYFHEHQNKGNRKYFTIGIGLKLNVVNLDFAYLIPRYQNHPLANTIRFTLALDFDDLKQERSNN